jgi:hypothetical protein
LKLEARIHYIAFIIVGIIFMLVGQALNELDIIETINASSIGTSNELDQWYEFLLPYIGDSENGLPIPWSGE